MEGSCSRYRFVFVAFSSFSLFLCTSSAARVAPRTTNTEFIKTSCNATTYPRLCYTSLANQATIIRSDPKLLAQAALSVSLTTARSTSATMVKHLRNHGMKPREIGGTRDCIEQLSDSVDQLRNSMAEMTKLSGPSFDFQISDIQTWVSSALTDDDTCMEGFSGKHMKGKTKIAVRGAIVNVARLTSNALALVNSYASIHS